MASSGYTAWSVVAGETPTTTKWNLLGSNDASFNTGQGINDSGIIARHMADQTIINRHIALNAIFVGAKTVAGETTYVNGSYVNVGGMSMNVTTTKANQVVTVISSFQTYSGGYSQFRYTVDGTAVGDALKYQTGTNNTTTGAYTFIDYFTIASIGTHTVFLQANSGATLLRIIHGEGTGRMVAFLG